MCVLVNKNVYILRLNGKDLMLVGVVLGLNKEGERVRKLYKRFKPQCIALGISGEGVRGLEAVLKGEVKHVSLSPLEEIYAKKLSIFGEVQIPPPAYVELYKLAQKNGLRVIPLDMAEREFTDLYVKKVGYLELLKISKITNRAKKRKFDTTDPYAFVLDWDAYVNSTKGIMAVERHREWHMAQRIVQITRNLEFNRIMVVVEYQRLNGIYSRLIS